MDVGIRFEDFEGIVSVIGFNNLKTRVVDDRDGALSELGSRLPRRERQAALRWHRSF